jgi:hypothetical protein
MFCRKSIVKFLHDYAIIVSSFMILWSIAYIYNKPDLQSNLIQDSDQEFLKKFAQQANSSQMALKNLKLWVNHNMNGDKIVFNKSNKIDMLCVGIISKHRFNLRQYHNPLITISSLLNRIQLKYQDRVNIQILNIDIRGEELSFVKDLVQVTDLTLNKEKTKYLDLYNPKVRESLDYVNVMRHYVKYYNKTCKYVNLVEDDALASENWYLKINQALDYVERNSMSNTWICLKLFSAFRWYDWFIDRITLIKFLSSSILISFFVSFLLFKRIFYSRFRFFLILLNSFLIFLWLNSSSVNPMGYGVKKISLGFNTVSNLYPMHVLNSVANFIEANTENITLFEPKDLLLKKYQSMNNYDEYLVIPSIYQHVGLQSALAYSPINLAGIKNVQYRPFQSYSFIKEYDKPIQFDPNYFGS